jgi:hypothetical protein
MQEKDATKSLPLTMSFRSAPVAASALNSLPSLIVFAYLRHRLTRHNLNISLSIVVAIFPHPLTAAANASSAAFFFSSLSLEGSSLELHLALAFKLCTKRTYLWIDHMSFDLFSGFPLNPLGIGPPSLQEGKTVILQQTPRRLPMSPLRCSSLKLPLTSRFEECFFTLLVHVARRNVTQVMGEEMHCRPLSFLRIAYRPPLSSHSSC